MSNTSLLDQWFTQPENVVFCLIELSKLMDLYNKSWIEPAGGTGVFIDGLSYFNPTRVVSYDLDPRHPLIQKADFLEITPPNSDIGIGNPPFGKNAGLAKKFFNHLAPRCSVIAFIVPKSFRKISVYENLHKKIPFNFRRGPPH